jgi:hypothetical protein
MEILVELIGWVGTVLIILAYFLVSNKKVGGNSKIYQTLNLFGAVGIGVNVIYHRAWPAFAMEIAWASIAILALIKNFQNTNTKI